MVAMFCVTIGYQNIDRESGTIRPKAKTITKLFRTKVECENFASYWDSGTRHIMFVTIHHYARTLTSYLADLMGI